MARRLYLVRRKRKRGDQSDLHRTRRLSQSRMLLLHHDLHLNWIRLPVLPRSGLVYKTSACAALPSRNKGNCSREDLHLEPPPSQSGVQGSYTSRASEIGGCVRNRAELSSS